MEHYPRVLPNNGGQIHTLKWDSDNSEHSGTPSYNILLIFNFSNQKLLSLAKFFTVQFYLIARRKKKKTTPLFFFKGIEINVPSENMYLL